MIVMTVSLLVPALSCVLWLVSGGLSAQAAGGGLGKDMAGLDQAMAELDAMEAQLDNAN